MKIVIPMSGMGNRFVKAGYKTPKPLIEMDGIPIIEHVVKMFSGEQDFVFICNSKHLKETKMRAMLQKIAPKGEIVEIPPHKKGPVYAVHYIENLIDDEEEVIVNYCDFSCYWNYATGNKGEVVENIKLYNLKNTVGEIFYSLGGLVYLLPVILFFGFRGISKKSVWIWAGFVFIIFLSIALIIKQQVYIDRNILPFLTALVLITGVMLDSIVKLILSNSSLGKKLKPGYLYGIILVLIFLPIWGYSKNYVKTIFPNAKNNIESTIDRITDKANRRLVTIDYSADQNFEGYSSKIELPSAIPTNGNNFKRFVRNSIGDFQEQDVVLVSEIKNNRQLTTYVLPGIFNSNIQYDKYFVFYNDPDKDKEFQKLNASFNSSNTKALLKDSVAIRQDLVLREIKIEKGKKIYLKFDFLAAKKKDWNNCRFYFHGKANEEDIKDLPSDRIEHGFEGWDFTISEDNTYKYGNSMYVVHEFEPSLKRYKEFSFGIFRGCTKSEEFKIKNVTLSE